MIVVWLVLGVALVAVELHHLAFYALFGALGAFAAAIVAAAAPEAYPLQVGVAAVVVVLGILAVRPLMSRALDVRHEGQLGRGVHGSIIGEEVITLDVVGDAHAIGHVRMAGERWLAVSGSGGALPAGTKAVVTAVKGTTLTVWPADLDPPVLPAIETEPSNDQPPERAKGEQL